MRSAWLAGLLLFSSPASAAEREALHVLNRLTYGPRPGDVERVSKMTPRAFIEEQLRPERLPDAECERALGRFESLSLSAGELAKKFPKGKGRRLLGGAKPKDLVVELASAKLARAVASERQLLEVMTDFWFNHFNVSAQKGAVVWLVGPYERDVIRPRALGKFRDLLGAVAHSPAMLVYLDNAQSTIDARYAPPEAQEELEELAERMAARKGSKGGGRARLGLNENYARELLELHTLGVDGGYTQKDVTEVARVLTGWSVVKPGQKGKDAAFRFRGKLHDPGDKLVLGERVAGAGEEEGERVLDRLAKHPSTAKHLAVKLCRRFVADDPPSELVERVARRFAETDGDIRETLRALLASPEFLDARAFRAKVRTPFEYVAAALRATGAALERPEAAVKALAAMGQPLYACEPPTGYPDRADAWVSAGGLLARLRLAEALVRPGRKSPARVDLDRLTGGAEGAAAVDALVRGLLHGEVAEGTRAAVLARLDHPELRGGPRNAKLAALILGSPDFQRR